MENGSQSQVEDMQLYEKQFPWQLQVTSKLLSRFLLFWKKKSRSLNANKYKNYKTSAVEVMMIIKLE